MESDPIDFDPIDLMESDPIDLLISYPIDFFDLVICSFKSPKI